MKMTKQEELKNYIFKDDGDIVFVRDRSGQNYQKSKATVMAEFRNKKLENVILRYEVQKSIDLNVYHIYQKEGRVTVHMHPLDSYNRTLQMLLNRQNTPNDEVYVTIKTDQYADEEKTGYQMRHAYTDETKEGTDLDELFEHLTQLKTNGEIDHTVKTGNEILRYDFYTTYNEIIHIYVDRSHLEEIRKLDTFHKETIHKKQGLKKLIATGFVGVALVVGAVAVAPIAKDFVITQQEGMEKAAKIEKNMQLIQSYYTRLGNYAYGLTYEDFENYKYLVNETLILMDKSDVSYPFLQNCLEQIDNAYSPSPAFRYKAR